MMNGFEASEVRHNELRQERLNVQKKTFTKWANIHLQKHGFQVEDLFRDLGDGKRLMKLLEVITGEKLGRPTQGSSRINKIENVSRCLAFLHSKKMRLENISSEDIVDGKPNLILGLLWTIILRCEIWNLQQNAIQESEPVFNETPFTKNAVQPAGQKIAKDTLLLWCQTKTDGYPGVKVKNFGKSWRDGLAFHALIHSHLPNLVDFSLLDSHQHVKNLNKAFDLALKYIGVPKLLDPEDVDTDNPDEKSILIYVSTFCKGLANLKKGMTGGKRISNILSQMMEIDKLKEDYDDSVEELIDWIFTVINDFRLLPASRSLEDIHEEIAKFKVYRTEEKPQWFESRNDSEATLFSIQMQLKSLGQVEWTPPHGKSAADIERAWSRLETAEHEHELTLREQLKSQENLENLAHKFESKRSVRDGYLRDMQKVLTDPNYGANVKQVDATFKKHEAVRAGVLSREDMFQDLFKIADFLISADYRRKDEIAKERDVLKENWSYVKRLLAAYDETFENLRRVVSILEETDAILSEMQQMEAHLRSEGEPLDVESCLQQHALTEVQLASWSKTVQNISGKVEDQDRLKSAPVLQTQLQRLQRAHHSLMETSLERRLVLEAVMKRNQRLERLAEIEAWINEMKLYCKATLMCRDLPSALYQSKKHKFLGSELVFQKELADEIVTVDDGWLNDNLLNIQQLWEEKSDILAFAVQVYQYQTDADESDSWITEKLNLMRSTDCGKDELTCQALLRRHAHAEVDINVYGSEVQSLRIEAKKICFVELAQSYSLSENDVFVRRMSLQEDVSGTQKTSGDLQSMTPVTNQIAKRQEGIEQSYVHLKNLCEERKQRLQSTEAFYRLNNDCDEMEAWLTQKEQLVMNNVVGEASEEIEKYIEVFIADMLTRSSFVQNLEATVQMLEEQNFEEVKVAKSRLDGIQKRWKRLNEWKSLKESSMKGFTSLLLSYRLCEETRIWIVEKMKALQGLAFGGEIRNLNNLRRKSEQLHRELIPVEEKLKQTITLSETAAVTYPEERGNLLSKVHELEDLWDQVQRLSDERRRELHESAGYEFFRSNAEALLDWSKEMMLKISVHEKMTEVSLAESVANDHRDHGNEVATRDDQFDELIQIGASLRAKNIGVDATVHRLEEARKCVQDMWQDKEDWIQQCLDQQIFMREANLLESLCSSYDALLEKAERGQTLGDVEILVKHHETLIETLKAQDNRYAAFDDMANKLINAGHFESEFIDVRREQILHHRRSLKEKSQQYKTLLMDAFEFELFKADAHEMQVWIDEKEKLSLDISSPDIMTDLQRKMKRQETFQAELAANEDRLEIVNTRGQALILESRYPEEEVINLLEQLNESWRKLCDVSKNNMKQLKGAHQLQIYEKSVEKLEDKLNEICKSFDKDTGHDLRSSKRRLKEHEVLEHECKITNARIFDLMQEGERITAEHFATEEIDRKTKDLQSKMQAIEGPMNTRRHMIECSLSIYQFLFDVDFEMLWITEHQSLLTTETETRNLLHAQKRLKKMENLEVTIEGHKAVIDNILEKGQQLMHENACPPEVQESCDNLQSEWKQLLTAFDIKKGEAHLSLRIQMFFSEVAEIESWIDEKHLILSNDDCGKDENAVVKLLTNHKAVELEIDSYIGLLAEVSNQADVLVDAVCNESETIRKKMESVNQEMKIIQDLCFERRQKLLQSKSHHEFLKEMEELEIWIKEQMVEALSEDYGQDYEHILELHSKFEFFRAKLEANTKRVLQFEDFAKKLISSNCDFAEEVKTCLENLSQFWSELVENADARTFKMEAAAEIHRYHRDVTDVLARIQDNYQSMNGDLGHNFAHIQALVKKHDAFEHDLLALEAQVHLLVQDSQRLQEAYPGGNEEHIQMQVNLVIENWNLLEQKASLRKAQLLSSLKAHKFLTTVRDMENWAESVRLELATDERVRDISAVERLEAQHELLGVEIEARNGNLPAIEEEKLELLNSNECDHLHSQIEEKSEWLLAKMRALREAWQIRAEHITKFREICSFFDDAKAMEIQCSKKEVQLCGSEVTETVEDIETALKKHLDLQRTIKIQDQKFETWKNQGEYLINHKVSESEIIRKKIDDLSMRRKKLCDFSKEKSERLADDLLYAKFRRDTIEAESWIVEKKNRLRSFLKKSDELNIEEKVLCLQKQQALQAELKVHEPRMANIKEQGDEVFRRMTLDPDDATEAAQVPQRLRLLLDDWEDLRTSAARIGSDLQEARHIVEFRERAQIIETWLKQKELMISANDTGEDHEHVKQLQQKFDDLDSGAPADQASMEHLKELAYKSTSKGHEDNILRYGKMEQRWTKLQIDSEQYRKELAGASEVHALIKNVNDIIERIREKRLILSQKEELKHVAAIEMQRRKINLLQKDAKAVEFALNNHFHESETLSKRNTKFSITICTKMTEARQELNNLNEQLDIRKEFLDDTYKVQLFLDEVSSLKKTANGIIDEMKMGEIPVEINQLNTLVHMHEDKAKEISTRQKEIKSLVAHGRSLPTSAAIEKALKTLSDLRLELDLVYQTRRKTLSENLELQIFIDKAKNIERWLSAKETYFTNEDVGDSLTSVDTLTRKHGGFEQSHEVYQERIAELTETSQDLVNRGHTEKDSIEGRSLEIYRRNEALTLAAKNRKLLLEQSRGIQQFKSGTYEILHWLNQRLRILQEDRAIDLNNCISKALMFNAFESEVTNNELRVKEVINYVTVLESNNLANDEMLKQVREAEELWAKLLELCAEKKENIKNAHLALAFKLKLDNVDSWILETEEGFEFDDQLHDLTSLQRLMMHIKEIESELHVQSDALVEAEETLKGFKEEEHFLVEEMSKLLINTDSQMNRMRELVAKKTESLENAISLAQLEEDIEEQLSWINEKLDFCSAEQSFKDILSVQALQKQLDVLETELSSRESLINAIVEKADRMIEHPQYSVAESKVSNLKNCQQELKNAISDRKAHLGEALEAQNYYFEALLAEAWMQEKSCQLNSADTGHGVHSVQTLIKRADAIKIDIENYSKNMQVLQELSSCLISRNHYDQVNVEDRQAKICEHYNSLQQSVIDRIATLNERLKYFIFVKEVRQMIVKFTSMSCACNSEELGRDVEHVESLIRKFEDFQAKIGAFESSVNTKTQTAEAMIAENHTESETITDLLEKMQNVWTGLEASAKERFETMKSAKLLHSFNRSADDTIRWIQEKMTILDIEDHGHDVATIKTLLKQHVIIEGDMEVIKEQVENLSDEADSLCDSFAMVKEQINTKYKTVVETWQTCQKLADDRKIKLCQAESFFFFIEETKDFQAEVQDIVVLMGGAELPNDVETCEVSLHQIEEQRMEIDHLEGNLKKLETQGQAMILSGNFKSVQVEDRIAGLRPSLDSLNEIWESRKITCENHLDMLIFNRKINHLEEWLHSQQQHLVQEECSSLEEVDNLMRKHDKLEKLIIAYDEKFEELKAATKLEESIIKKRIEEETKQLENQKRIEKLKAEEVKRQEDERILEERKKEGYRARAQLEAEGDDDDYTPTHGNSSTVFKRVGSTRYDSISSYVSAIEQPPALNKRLAPHLTLQQPPTTAEGFLERKQELAAGGTRSTTRQWKNYYTVLCGHLLCFYKDKASFAQQSAANSKPPVSILGATARLATDYKKRKNVFRLTLRDKSEFLFMAAGMIKRDDWMSKIEFAAGLSPDDQLTYYGGPSASGGTYERMPSIDSQYQHRRSASIMQGGIDDQELETVSLEGRTMSEPPTLQSSSNLQRVQSTDSSLSSQSRSSYATALSSTSTLQNPSDSSEEGDWHSVLGGSTPPEPAHRSATDLVHSQRQAGAGLESARSTLSLRRESREPEKAATAGSKKGRKWMSLSKLSLHRK